jgi:tetratricopeptide (TPR) repeat protein
VRRNLLVSWCILCLVFILAGGTAGWVFAKRPPTSPLYRGKTPEQAAAALLAAAEEAAESGSWELIAVGRVHYLAGNKEKGQDLFDRVTNGRPEGSDWFRIGKVYAEAGEWDKAAECLDKALRIDPKDDSGMILAGAHYNLNGDREGAEKLFDRAFAKEPYEFWHMVGAAGSYIGVVPD